MPETFDSPLAAKHPTYAEAGAKVIQDTKESQGEDKASVVTEPRADGTKLVKPVPDDGISSDEEESDESEGDQDGDDELFGQEEAEDYDVDAMENATIKVQGHFRKTADVIPLPRKNNFSLCLSLYSLCKNTQPPRLFATTVCCL